MSNEQLAFATIVNAINTIIDYSKSSTNADEIWDIIQNHLPKLKDDISLLIT